MDARQKQVMDDMFAAFSMLAGGSFVTVMHVEGQVTRFSPGAVELLGLPGEYFENAAFDWSKFLHPEDRRRYEDAMAPLLSGQSHTYDITYRVMTTEQTYTVFRAIGAVLRNEAGDPSVIGGVLINQGHLELTDQITMLRNKSGFQEDLNRIIGQGEENVVVLLMGFSKLSELNRVHGYAYGNRVLQEVGWTIQEIVGDRGQVYRMDDATFAVLSCSQSRQQLAAIYDSLRLKLQRGIRAEGIRNILLANGGMFALEGRQVDASVVCSYLQYAYHESKERMHGELVDYNGTVDYEVMGSIEMVGEIRNSIIEGCKGFSLMYQPILDVHSRDLIGVEALVRWEKEPYGMVEPMEFIPILEKDFIFEELGDWVLQQAMTEVGPLLQLQPDLLVGLNISSLQLESEYFVDSVKESLDQTGFPPENLCLEFTRDCRLLEAGRLQEIVTALHQVGVRVILDDFGSGFDSIQFLKNLRVDSIKLDRGLVDGIAEDPVEEHMLDHLIRLGQAREIRVIAKCIETEEMDRVLQRLSLNSAQGNYYSLPLDIEGTKAYLTARAKG